MSDLFLACFMSLAGVIRCEAVASALTAKIVYAMRCTGSGHSQIALALS